MIYYIPKGDTRMKTYIIISALFVCMLLSCTGTVSAKEIMVGPGYGNTTITAALANASNGDIITVTDGTYTENVDVAKAVTIRSQNGSSNTNIKASSSSDHIFKVSVDNVAISGFNITGASGYSKAGIYLDGVSGCTLTNNTASGNYYGIYLESSASNTLTNNTASNNSGRSIYLHSSASNTLTNNTASNNSYYGISLRSSDSNTLTNNTASNNSNYGIYLDYSASNTLTGNMMSQNEYNLHVQSSVLTYYLNDIDTSNLVNSKPVYYLTNSSDAVVPSNAGVVYAINCTNVSMQDINITNEYYGVLFYETDNSTIENATISECNYGIYLSSSASNTLTNNTANDNVVSISLYLNSASNTLTNNTANDNVVGISPYYSDSNTLTNNTASNNSNYGILLSSSASNTLTNNTACNNSDCGIYLYSNSDNNTLTNNTASNNSHHGIYLRSSDNNTLTNNTASNNSNYGISLDNSASNTLTNNQVDNNTPYDLRLYSSASNLINPLILGDDLAELTFTSNSSTVEILRNETNANDFSGKTNINGYIEINSVLSSMNMSLFYDDTGMSSTKESTIALYKLNGTEWNEVQNTILDTSSNTLSVNLTEFGTFALFKDPEPAATTTTTSSSSGTRASVSQGQSPDIVERSASSVKRITGGSEVNYDFSDSGTPVLGVSFDAKKDKGLVVARVQVLSSTPEGVPSASGNSYQMMSIDVGSEGTISSDSADNVMIHFKVSKQWIEENDIDLSTIRMTRYHGDQWNDLPTSQESEDNEYFYFYAETPGFSVFNVVGDEISAASKQVPASELVTEEVEEPVEEPVEEKETKDTPGFTILAGIMFVSFAVLVRKR